MARTPSTQAQAATQIRTKLKAIGIKAKVRSDSASMTSAVRVKVENLSPADHEKVNNICAPYQYGNFNGMIDCYEYNNTHGDLPQVKYVMVENRFDDTMKQTAWDFIVANYRSAADEPKQYADVPRDAKVCNMWAEQFLYQFLNGSYDKEETEVFWATQKPQASVKVTPKATAPEGDVEAVTVRTGQREGYSEILFPAKPSSEARAELKTANFRWSPRNKVWWGKTENLPAAYA